MKQSISSNNLSRIGQLVVILLILFAGYSSLVSAIGGSVYVGPVPNTSFKAGRVMARSIVVDPDTGQPIMVEFDKDGKEVSKVDTSGYNVEELIVYPAADYLFSKKQLSEYREQYADTLAKNAELLSRRQFDQRQFLLADNKTVIKQGPLSPNVRSVLVRSQNNLILNPTELTGSPNDYLILLKFDIDLTQNINVTESNISLVINDDGQVIASSPRRQDSCII